MESPEYYRPVALKALFKAAWNGKYRRLRIGFFERDGAAETVHVRLYLDLLNRYANHLSGVSFEA